MDETVVKAAADKAAREAEERTRAAERARVAGINEAADVARKIGKIDEAMVRSAIEGNTTVEEFRASVLTSLATASETAPTRSAAHIDTSGPGERDHVRAGLSAALAYRANPVGQVPEAARPYMGRTLRELARMALESQGVKTEGMDPMEIAGRALGMAGYEQRSGSYMTTSDFAVALASTVNRTLRAGYESAPRTFQAWARQTSLPDFRAVTRVAIDGALKPEKVNEHGEFKRGSISDAGETYALATYGKIVAVSRQVIINDDVGMIARIPQLLGRAAADFESDTVYGALMANPVMGDGTSLFHASHGNLAGTGTGIDVASLSAARQAMRTQTAPASKQPLNLTPTTLIVGAARETAAEQFLAAEILASKAADTNPFKGRLMQVVEPRVTGSPEPWFVVADPMQIDTAEYAYLDGQNGLYTEQKIGFDVDGLEVKARLDFAFKVIDWRAFYKNPGA